MKPRSVLTPTFSRPMSSVLGARPTATSTFSASIFSWPPLPSTVTSTPPLPFCMDSALVAVAIFTPRF